MNGRQGGHDVGGTDEQVGDDARGFDPYRREAEIEDGEAGQVDDRERLEEVGGEANAIRPVGGVSRRERGRNGPEDEVGAKGMMTRRMRLRFDGA